MSSLSERIRDWEEITFYTYKGEHETKPFVISFAVLLWVPVVLSIVISAIIYKKTFEISDIFYLILFAGIAFGLCCIAGVFLMLVCEFIMKILNIRSPLKGIASTIVTLLFVFGCYSLYRAYWPIGEEQILKEDFESESQKGIITVIHKERCKYYRGFYQDKENFQEYVKGKNYMYCTCVHPNDMDILDSYSKKNQWKVKDKIIKDGMQGYYDIGEDYDGFEEWYDETSRGYRVFHAYDVINGGYKRISSEEIQKEYYSLDE